LCDALLILADGSLVVHRAVLAKRSDFFKREFSNDVKQLNIRDISTRTMDIILDHAYTLEPVVHINNVRFLLPLACRFELSDLVKECCNTLAQDLRVSNCLGILITASEFSCDDLVEETTQFVHKHFKAVSTQSNELFNVEPAILKSLMSSDHLNAADERLVFDAICRWVSHAPDVRMKHVSELLSCVRMSLLKPEFLSCIINYENNEDDQCEQKVLQVLMHHMADNLQDPQLSMTGVHRVPHELLLAVGGWSGRSPTSYIEVFDSRAEEWLPEADVGYQMGPVAYHGCIALGSDVYVVGGFNGSLFFNDARCFSLINRSWKSVAPMNIARCYISLAALNGCLYALGGFDGHTRHNSCERFTPELNQWDFIAPMLRIRSDAGASSLDGKLYVTGGFDGQNCLDTAEAYDPMVDQWTFVTPMLTPRSGLGVIALDDKLYAVGGFDGHRRLDNAEAFDPLAQKWTQTSAMTTGRSNFGIERVDDGFLVAGGYNGTTTIHAVEMYSPAEDLWTENESMQLNRSALSVCRVEGVSIASRFLARHSGAEEER
ncbi:hypothetical protein CAPTEDRAFT_143807, partial [Capitella teleta]